MRTLKFIVKDQIIEKDPNCDFENLVPGTEGYLQAEFKFSSEWAGCVRFAEFSTALGSVKSVKPLKYGQTCLIPADVLKKRTFKIRVIGKKEDFEITTDKVAVSQNGGKT